MFYGFLLVLLIIASIVLVLAILAQAGKGGGLAASFGGASSSESFMGTRQASNLFIKASWYAGGLFLALSYILSLASTRQGVPGSTLDRLQQRPAAGTPAPAAGAPSILGDLSKSADTGKGVPPAGKAGDTSKTPGKIPPGN